MFGRVISGMKIVDAIAVVETTTKQMYQDVPVEPIRILSARLVNPEVWSPITEMKPKEKKAVFRETRFPLNNAVKPMTALSINLNKIALIRNSREGQLPQCGRACAAMH